MDADEEFTLGKIKEHLILTQEHLTDYPCPFCLKKHFSAISGYASEGLSMPMSKDEEIRTWLIKVKNFANTMRRKLGDVL